MAEIIALHEHREEPGRCVASTATGKRCRNRAADESGLCGVHRRQEGPPTAAIEERIGPFAAESVREFLSFVSRRMVGDYDIDEFGFDPELTEKVLAPIARVFHEKWWRVDWKGLEHVPASGSALLVSNHAGTVPWDAVVMKFGVLDRTGRHVRLLAADLAFRMPFISSLARKSGNTLACDEDALRLLENDQLLGVFPEGYKGVGKRFQDRYRLQRFGRGGFIEIALRAQVPIIPVAVVGSEEIYPMISQAKPIARMFNLPYFPITPFFPWLGPLGAIPLPTKWVVEFGEPIHTEDYDEDSWEDALLLFELTDRVRDDIQEMLYRNVVSRRSVFW